MADQGAGNGVGGSRNFWNEIEPYREKVRQTVHRIIGDADTAAQIEQEACTRAEQRFHHVPSGQPLYFWYLRVAVRDAFKWLKRHKRFVSYDPQFIARLADVENDQLIEDVRDAFQSLPVIERFVLRMLKDFGLNMELVGALIGKSPYITKKIEATALEALRASLKAKGHDCYPKERERRSGIHAGGLRPSDILNLKQANAMILSATGPYRGMTAYLDKRQKEIGFRSKAELCKWIDDITKLSNFDDLYFCDSGHPCWDGKGIDPLLIDGTAKKVLPAGRELVLLNRWWIVLGDATAFDQRAWEKRMGLKLNRLKKIISEKLNRSHLRT